MGCLKAIRVSIDKFHTSEDRYYIALTQYFGLGNQFLITEKSSYV